MSDDMAWGRKKLADKNNDVYFEGCGDGDNADCVGEDLVRRNCLSLIMSSRESEGNEDGRERELAN